MEETRQANVEDRALDRERSADIKLPRWSIRTWLVALVAVSVVPLVAFVGALTWLSYKSARETAVTSVQTATRALMQVVDNELDARTAVLQTLALSVALHDGDLVRFYDQARTVSKEQMGGGAIALMDTSGQMILHTNYPLGSALPVRNDLASNAKVVETGEPWISDVVVGAVSKRPIVTVNVAVRRDGPIVYVLSCSIALSQLNDMLLRQRLPAGWIGAVTDRTGTLVARSVRNDETVGKRANPIYVAAVSQATEGTVSLVSREGDPVISAWTRSPVSGWAVSISQPSALFVKALRRDLVMLSLAALVALIVGLGGAVLLARRIALPLARLAAGTARFGLDAQTQGAHSPVREIEEVGHALAQTSNRLMQREAERDATEAQQRMLLAELDHRVKNMLATAQAIARLSLGRNPETDAFVGRLKALTDAHALLAIAQWRSTALKRIVAASVAAHRNDDGRIEIQGPGLHLQPKASQALILLFHEMVTNAAKYGSLSVPNGRLRVAWRLEKDQQLVFDWWEENGPPVSPPEHEGFGSRLIRLMAAQELRGDVVREYLPQGLHARIAIPFHLHEAAAAAERAAETAALGQRPQPRSLAGQRILVVEDVAVVAAEATDMLVRAGCEVIGPAATLQEALVLASGAPMDAAILDVNLAGEEAFPAAARLRGRGIPFLFVTGYGETYAWPEEFAAAPRLSKPLQSAELLAALTTLLWPERRPTHA